MSISPLLTRVGIATALFLTAGCSGDGDSDPKEPSKKALHGPIVEVTSEEICAALDGDEVGDAIDIDVTATQPSKPGCSYSFGSADGTTYSSVVVGATNGVGAGADLAEGFEFILDANRAVGGKAEESEVDAGDRAVLLDGDDIDVAVLAVDGHLLTVTVGDKAISATKVANLLKVVADNLGD